MRSQIMIIIQMAQMENYTCNMGENLKFRNSSTLEI